MIELLQQTSNLIGSISAIKELEHKENARILTISDSHGNYRLLAKIVKRFGPECDAMIFCGDGAKDIAELLELTNEDESFKSQVPSVIAFVRGNGDPDTYPVSFDIGRNNSNSENYPKGTVLFPYKQTLSVNGQKIYISHGHLEGVDFGYDKLGLQLKFNECKTAIHGHTHIPHDSTEFGFKFVNPGSISRPRGGMPATFAILTVGNNFIDTAFIKINNTFDRDDSYNVTRILV